MKITLKLILAMLGSTAIIFAGNAYFRVRREVSVFRANMVHDVRLLGQTLEVALADTWRTHGRQRVLDLLAETNASTKQIHLRWLSPDVATGADHDRLPLTPSRLAGLRQGDSMLQTMRGPQGETSLVLYMPVIVGHEMSGVLVIDKSLAPLYTYIRRTVLRTVVVWIGLVGLSGGIMFCIGALVIGRPMRQVIEKSRRVGAGDLDGPLEIHSRDEFAEVAVALNQMSDQLKVAQAAVHAEMESRLQALQQLRHADRLKTIGTLASGIAHELGTPLNVVWGRASLIASGRLASSEVTESVGIIKEQVQRMTAIIRRLLDFARRKTPSRATTDLGDLVQQTLLMLKPSAAQHHATLAVVGSDATVRGKVDTEQIRQVLINLVTNAWQAMPEGGQIEVHVGRKEGIQPPPGLNRTAACYACLSVTDQGEGIPAEDLYHIFDPFFTTKGVGEGTGLGLSVACGIVHDHDGWIDVVSKPGEGTCFTIYLPMEDEPCPDVS
jgi:two-component system NtrC family sensor kinase